MTAVQGPAPSTRARTKRRSRMAAAGAFVLFVMLAACLGTLPWTMGRVAGGEVRMTNDESGAATAPASIRHLSFLS
jgi:uncharacterized iron-regulated membrane protein